MHRLVILAVLVFMFGTPLAVTAVRDRPPLPALCQPPGGTPAAASPVATPEIEAAQIVLCAATTRLHLGEVAWVIGEARGLGLPIFLVAVRDAGESSATTVADVDYHDQVRRLEHHGGVLEPVAACGGPEGVAVAFRALAPGETEVTVEGRGEVHDASQGWDIYFWGSVISEPLRIVVVAGPGTPSLTASPVATEAIGKCPIGLD